MQRCVPGIVGLTLWSSEGPTHTVWRYAHKCVHLWRSALLSAIYCTSYLYLRLLLRQRRLCNASTVACLLVLWWRVVVKVVSILHWVIGALGLGGHVLSLVVFLLHLGLVEAGDASDGSASKPPMFDGTRIGFVAWMIGFSAFTAWRLTDATGLLDRTELRPVPTGTGIPAARHNPAGEVVNMAAISGSCFGEPALPSRGPRFTGP